MQIVDALSLVVKALTGAAIVSWLAFSFSLRGDLANVRDDKPRIERSGSFSPEFETVDPYAAPPHDEYEVDEGDWGH